MPTEPPKDDRRRRAAFGAFVTRALAHARASGVTLVEIERRTQRRVTRSTVHRWRTGDWIRDPNGSQVREFCKEAGVQWETAKAILGWSEDPERKATEPIGLTPEMQQILQRLRDPNVPTEEKYLIRETLRSLADRSNRTDRAG